MSGPCPLIPPGAFSRPATTRAWSSYGDCRRPWPGRRRKSGIESYPVGTFANPAQNGWTDFGGTQPVTISTTQAHSGTNSMRLAEGAGGANGGYGSDVYRNFIPSGVITSGTVNFSYWQFIEP